MTKTVREWIKFLDMGPNHLIGVQMKNGVCCKDKYHFEASKCLEEYEPWLDEIAIEVWVRNSCSKGNYYHLLIIAEK